MAGVISNGSGRPLKMSCGREGPRNSFRAPQRASARAVSTPELPDHAGAFIDLIRAAVRHVPARGACQCSGIVLSGKPNIGQDWGLAQSDCCDLLQGTRSHGRSQEHPGPPPGSGKPGRRLPPITRGSGRPEVREFAANPGRVGSDTVTEGRVSRQGQQDVHNVVAQAQPVETRVVKRSWGAELVGKVITPSLSTARRPWAGIWVCFCTTTAARWAVSRTAISPGMRSTWMT